jgi:hypothetical protein
MLVQFIPGIVVGGGYPLLFEGLQLLQQQFNFRLQVQELDLLIDLIGGLF